MNAATILQWIRSRQKLSSALCRSEMRDLHFDRPDDGDDRGRMNDGDVAYCKVQKIMEGLYALIGGQAAVKGAQARISAVKTPDQVGGVVGQIYGNAFPQWAQATGGAY